MGLRNLLDKVEHHFEKGGRYEKWYPLYEAVDTFLYRPAASPAPLHTCATAST